MGDVIPCPRKNQPMGMILNAVATTVQEATHPSNGVTQKDVRRHQVEGITKGPLLLSHPNKSRDQGPEKPSIKYQPTLPHLDRVKPTAVLELHMILKDIENPGANNRTNDDPSPQIESFL